MDAHLRSFAKINLGLRIGGRRPDGFHELRTVYQTIALHDRIRLRIERGSGIEIRCDQDGVPLDRSNTCYRIAELAIDALKLRGRVVIEIEKRLPIQGGLGGASGNAVSTLLGLERAAKKNLGAAQRLAIAAQVGSDLPLFLIGGTVLGVGRGEEVYPLPDLPPSACVLVTPKIAVSTPRAFAQWDDMVEAWNDSSADMKSRDARKAKASELTGGRGSDRMVEFGRKMSGWLSSFSQRGSKAGPSSSGVPAERSGGRVENPLLGLVRTGIENDFEQVVFPQYPELDEVKSVLRRAGAFYASLSGSGSALYGLFQSGADASTAAARIRETGIAAVATRTLSRRRYWESICD